MIPFFYQTCNKNLNKYHILLPSHFLYDVNGNVNIFVCLPYPTTCVKFLILMMNKEAYEKKKYCDIKKSCVNHLSQFMCVYVYILLQKDQQMLTPLTFYLFRLFYTNFIDVYIIQMLCLYTFFFADLIK